MLFEHTDHPDLGVRLAYCMNLHPAEDLEGVLEGMRTITLPLAERLGGNELRAGFGVGMWLPAEAALALTEEAPDELERLCAFVVEHGLDPFTFNAFPYRGFHDAGLKAGVFRPTWMAPERMAYTLAVARIATRIRAAQGRKDARAHLSISTHTGMYAAWCRGDEDRDACAEGLALTALHLAQLEEETGERIVLSLEPEPRSLANDTSDLPALLERVRVRSREVLGRGLAAMHETAEAIVRQHLGTCLDTCHAAVEFEEPEAALRNATLAGSPLGKLQFSSALALARPDANPEARAILLGLDEPVYLHQVTGRRDGELVRADDLPELRALWEGEDLAWRDCDEWRCHFHVPVDRETLGPDALGTTRAAADASLRAALAAPDRWSTRELHVEIETYTWGVLSGELRGPGDLVDGLEREYAHVVSLLEAAGWHTAR